MGCSADRCERVHYVRGVGHRPTKPLPLTAARLRIGINPNGYGWGRQVIGSVDMICIATDCAKNLFAWRNRCINQ
jgi:hypothetical protein